MKFRLFLLLQSVQKKEHIEFNLLPSLNFNLLFFLMDELLYYLSSYS